MVVHGSQLVPHAIVTLDATREHVATHQRHAGLLELFRHSLLERRVDRKGQQPQQVDERPFVTSHDVLKEVLLSLSLFRSVVGWKGSFEQWDRSSHYWLTRPIDCWRVATGG